MPSPLERIGVELPVVHGRLATGLGWLYFGAIVILALAAIPLLLPTNAGGG